MMNESYAEWLVKRKEPSYALVVKILMGFLVIAFGAVALTGGFGLLGIIPVVLVVAAAYFVLRNFQVEYEYLFISGTLSIDKITARAKRRKVGEYNLDEILLIAPEMSERTREYDRQVKMTLDYTSNNPEARRYAVICQKGAQYTRLLIEPSANMIHCFKMAAPRKTQE